MTLYGLKCILGVSLCGKVPILSLSSPIKISLQDWQKEYKWPRKGAEMCLKNYPGWKIFKLQQDAVF